jgi:hypothetical protein
MNNRLKELCIMTLAAGALLVSFPAGSLYAEDVAVTHSSVDVNGYLLSYRGPEKEFSHGIRPGYGSSLALKSVNADGSMDFYCITDRGPNGDIPTYVKNGKKFPGKFFPTPRFTPSIGILHVNADGKAAITSSIPIKDASWHRISGKVIPAGKTGSTGEVALDFNMNDLGTDVNGLDTEGIAIGKDGNLWLCDEYGPFLIKVNPQGKILKKYGPGMGLPAILAERVPNRGFEGVTVDENGYVYGMVQSPLNVDGKTGKKALYTRIVKLNPETGKVTMYAYPVDTHYKNTGAAKLGDITSIGDDEFLIIEQGRQNNKMQNLVYKVSLKNAAPIDENGDMERGILPKNFAPASKELVIDLRQHGWNIEKAEGLALLPDRRTIAVVNDNDFGIAVKVTDPDHQNTSVEDYTYDADRGQFFTADGREAPHVSMGLTQNAPEEQDSQIYFFKLSHKL